MSAQRNPQGSSAGMSKSHSMRFVVKIFAVVCIIFTQVLAFIALRRAHLSAPARITADSAKYIRHQATIRDSIGSRNANKDSSRMSIGKPKEIKQQQGLQQAVVRPLQEQQHLTASVQEPRRQIITPQIRAALSKPVRVVAMTGHFFGLKYIRTVPSCLFRDTGEFIQCEWMNNGDTRQDQADAFWYHAPDYYGSNMKKPREGVHTVIMSMESSAYYTQLDRLQFMDQFDIEMTYRLCSHVGVYYHPSTPPELKKLFNAPKPYEEKLEGIAFVNSNCAALSGRTEIVQKMINTKKYPVKAFGACLRNQEVEGRGDKQQIFATHKFCITMENSIMKDYMTEKLWDGFRAGCVPIYYGPPNTDDFVPQHSILDFNKFDRNVDRLMDEVVRLSRNRTAYEEYLAWKFLPFEQLAPSFQRYMVMADQAEQKHSQCRLCNYIMELRLDPGLGERRTHCLRNETWLSQNMTSWTAEAVSLPEAQRMWAGVNWTRTEPL